MYSFIREVKNFPISLLRSIWEVGREDPRKVIHAVKVGLSLTLVSLFYLMEPLYEEFGHSAMWAVMTVVLVLEFTAGATLCKGFNRGLGTIFAGSLAFLVQIISNKSGKVFCAIFVGTAVFLIGVIATYLRFFPCLKRNYEYGIVIFLLTFNLITMSSYRIDNVLEIAYDRLYTVAIGCGVCLIMCLLIFPHWSGEDLHNSMAFKLEALATSVEACVTRYFHDADIKLIEAETMKDKISCYQNVLDSKSTEETLAQFASWEPRHPTHCNRSHWQQYVKLGSGLRYFGYTVAALHGCMESEIQTPPSVRALFRDPCIRVAGEVAKILLELADSIRNRRQCSTDVLSDKLHKALRDLDSALRCQPRLFLGSNPTQAMAASSKRNPEKDHGAPLPSFNSRMIGDQLKESDGKVLGSTWSKIESNEEVLRPNFSKDASDEKVLQSNFSKNESSKVLRHSSSKAESNAKVLRPSLSVIATTGLDFSEALPVAACASLLIETVARLDVVTSEVEDLGKKAGFRELTGQQVMEVAVTSQKNTPEIPLKPQTKFDAQTSADLL